MSAKTLENYEAEVYAEIKNNYNRAVRSGTPRNKAARNANYRRTTAKVVAARRKSKNNSKRHVTWKNNTPKYQEDLKESIKKVDIAYKNHTADFQEMVKAEKEIEPKLTRFTLCYSKPNPYVECMNSAYELSLAYNEYSNKISKLIDSTYKYYYDLMDQNELRRVHNKTDTEIPKIEESIKSIYNYIKDLESKRDDNINKAKKAFIESEAYRDRLIERRRENPK